MNDSTPSSLERRSVFVVLFVYAVVAPLVPAAAANPWTAHLLFAAAFLGFTALGLVTRRGQSRVALAFPEITTVIALVALAFSTWRVTSLQSADVLQVQWTAATGLGHGLVFLAARRVFGHAGGLRAAPVFIVALAASLTLLVATEARDAVAAESLVAWRPVGPFANPNVLGAWAGALALLAARVIRGLVPRLLVTLAMVAVLLATRSRGALVITLFMASYAAPPGVARRRIVLALSALAFSLLVIPNPLRDRWVQAAAFDSFSRLDYWRFALSFIPEHPFGIGAGEYVDAVAAVAFDPARTWLVHQRHEVGLTHNALLTVWVEWGWLAGVAVVALIPWTVRQLAARDPRVPSGQDPLRRGATAAAGVVFLESLIDGVEQSALAFTLFLVVLALALARSSRREVVWQTLPTRVVGALGLLAVVALLAVGGQRERVFRALNEARRTTEARAAGLATLGDVDAAFETAATSHDRAVRAHLERGRLWADHARALPAGERAERLVALTRARLSLAAAAERDPRASAPGTATAEAWRLEVWAAGAGLSDPTRAETAVETALNDHLARDPHDVEALAARSFVPFLSHSVHGTEIAHPDVHAGRALALEPNYVTLLVEYAERAERANEPSVALYRYVRAAEAVVNARRLRASPSPASRAFYEGQLAATDLSDLLARAQALRRILYF